MAELPPTRSQAFVPIVSELARDDRVGNYVVREKIGEGGFAVVYKAEQLEPVRRPVALKVLQPGIASPSACT